jgi:hypothetical protein
MAMAKTARKVVTVEEVGEHFASLLSPLHQDELTQALRERLLNLEVYAAAFPNSQLTNIPGRKTALEELLEILRPD